MSTGPFGEAEKGSAPSMESSGQIGLSFLQFVNIPGNTRKEIAIIFFIDNKF